MSDTIVITEIRSEARRTFEICNACRYCEGFCAVFQEMTDHRTFKDATLDHLANLCHNCTACFHACQYKPPHEFAIDVPQVLAELRPQTWQEHAWPPTFARLLERRGVSISLLIASVFSLFLGLSLALIDQNILTAQHIGSGAFYKIIGHGTIVLLAGAASLWAIVAMCVSANRYRQSQAFRDNNLHSASVSTAWRSVLHDIFYLRHLGGGHDEGCNEEDDRFTNLRRYFHHLTMWGFLLCFAATSVATVYELLLGWQSPFPHTSLPVLLGIFGGIGLLIGPLGLLYLNAKRDDLHGMSVAFIVLLFLISLTGFGLLILRETSAMGTLLAIHLGLVLAFFVTLPYTKFVHAIYRTLALIQFHRIS